LFANYGFEPADGVRMRRCWQLLQKKLQTTPPLLHRNEQSKRLGEGPAAQCSFWAVEYLARGGGSLYEAQRALGTLLSMSNDVGLFAEHIDTANAQGAGNFPHAATHASLICAALSITQRHIQEGTGPFAGYVITMQPKEVPR
jgi:GH15 family glucan-1,4-alpha-glucosidase